MPEQSKNDYVNTPFPLFKADSFVKFDIVRPVGLSTHEEALVFLCLFKVSLFTGPHSNLNWEGKFCLLQSS